MKVLKRQKCLYVKMSQYDICTEHSEDVNRAVLQSDYNIYIYIWDLNWYKGNVL